MQGAPTQISSLGGEHVEHDIVGRSGRREPAGVGALGRHPLQQRRELETAIGPDDEFAVEQRVGEFGDR